MYDDDLILNNNPTYDGGSMNDISRNYGYKSVRRY